MRTEKLFINNTQLSGYKSIENISADLNSGLNIIIGKNAVGKTNFVNFFHKCLNFDFTHSNNFKSYFSIDFNRIKYEFQFEKKTSLQKIDDALNIKSDMLNMRRFQPNFTAKLKIDDRKNQIIGNFVSEEEEQCSEFFKNQLLFDNIQLNSSMIKHGLPKNYSIIDAPLSIELLNRSISDEFINLYNAENQSIFYKTLLLSTLTADILESNYFNKKLRSESSISKFISDKKRAYKKDILRDLEYLKDLKDLLRQYSPIEDLRFNDSFNLDIDYANEKVTLRNFFLEFSIDKKWFSFDDLSDGTKRTFYIISEIFILDRNAFKSDLFGKDETISTHFLNVIFIEEPELGIHPHQLFKLMKFLKEKSYTNQIIITTHSPLSLDILERDELEAILVAEKINGVTKLKKLSREKMDKAHLYMNELNLSDFWLNSDLED